MTKQMMMQKLRQYSFALNEANLFLDTHPNNRKALRYFNEIRRRYEELAAEYQKKYGPVTVMGNNSETSWQWIESPWPWQNGFCAETEEN